MLLGIRVFPDTVSLLKRQQPRLIPEQMTHQKNLPIQISITSAPSPWAISVPDWFNQPLSLSPPRP